eukprot:TRINITY_DN4157_c0_g1_i1.p1 TRINITY_DN4157_c0_g1~~TRINITY_DN4157_c0_g1_i1.p1  ORF type:complete len:301 (-),score=47.47 TRINITY_DN4157_c0_g1_i1:417-1271(-)
MAHGVHVHHGTARGCAVGVRDVAAGRRGVSAARLEMALACGITVHVPSLHYSCNVFDAAGASGSMEVVRRLHGLGMRGSRFLPSAARARRTGILYRLPALVQESGDEVTLHTWVLVQASILGAAYDDNELNAVLVWLLQQVRPWPVWYCTLLCHTAARKGRLAALKFLMHNDHGQALFGPLIRDLSAVDWSSPEWTKAPKQHFKWPSFAFDDEPEVDQYANALLTLMDAAAVGGRVEMLQWLRQEQGLPFTRLTMPCAAARGRLAALQWLHRMGCPHTSMIFAR